MINTDKRTITFIMNRVNITENNLTRLLKPLNQTQITGMKTIIRNHSKIDKMSAYDYKTCLKAMMISSNTISSGVDEFKWCYEMLTLKTDKKTSGILRKTAVNLIKNNNVPKLDYIIQSDYKNRFKTTMPDVKDIACFIHDTGLNAYDYIMLTNNHWNGLCELKTRIEMFPYAEYRTTMKELIELINHAIKHDDMMLSWINDFIIYATDEHPIITSEINQTWFDYYSQYPFEFYVENMQMSEPVSNNVYNDMVHEKIKLLESYGIPEHDVKACAFIIDNNRMITSKTRNVNSRNIQKWYNAISKITFKDELKPLLYYSNNQILNDNIDGYHIISDITRSSLISMANNPYKTMIQSSNASIEYINAIYHDDDSMYRWCIWLRAQRALRENRALIMFTETADLKDLYYSRPVFKHCPPELIKWLITGEIPVMLTYDNIAVMKMPSDVIKRIKSYPTAFNEWLHKNHQ